ncbi:MAG: fasciclin domain-containing protein [Eudoraea sp.]|uniref:fasciclin domain-containing protein n=1 Tax=Eudoraea sp. TaxID=1979955 RepID=UPI003266DF88
MKLLATPLSLLALLTSFATFSQTSLASVNNDLLKKTIIRSTEESQIHKMLLVAVKAADLEETLASDGPFTVFAPSDGAFEKMSADKIASLLRPENKRALQSLVTYHIVAGNFTASKILKAMCRGKGSASLTTVQGNELLATMDGLDIILTDCFGNIARITSADANQSNGVIHVIDSVILPNQL